MTPRYGMRASLPLLRIQSVAEEHLCNPCLRTAEDLASVVHLS